ncbi:MAG: glucose 1-dehydrogenase [Dehalococcoidales bacterium]|nr:glucose 1-dehydrogenase [Dehalococcoidales bacterium]
MTVFDDLHLEGKTALITGGSRGIGAAIAVAYAEAGADVALVGRSVANLEEVAERIHKLGRRALVAISELTDLTTISPLVEKVTANLGEVDILVNSAGINRRGPVLEVTLADWDLVFNTNLRSVYFLCQAVGRSMTARRRGKIVNLASTNAYRSLPDLSLYAMTKAAVARLTQTLAVEWAPYNVQANAIAPGWIDTPMTASMDPARKRWVDRHVPQGHFGETRDIVGLALYLASAAADYTTGQVFVVDGGFLAGSSWECGRE